MPYPTDLAVLDRSDTSSVQTQVRPARLPRVVSGLFAEAPARPLTRRAFAVGALAVLAGAAVSLARTTGTGPFQSIWEEDARNLLTDALVRPGAWNLVKPFVGYFQVGPRMMGEVAAFFPISWTAAALSVQAALVTALLALAVYVISGAQFSHPLARLLVSAPMLFAPVAENRYSEIYNRPATVQFFLVYAMFWLVLWVPGRRAGRVVLIGVVALSAVSTFLVAVFIPLAFARVYARRDRTSVALAVLLSAGAAIQILGLKLGLTNRAFVVPRYEPVWAAKSYLVWAVPQSVLGFRYAERFDGVVPVALSWLLVLAAVAIAARRLTRPLWILAAVAFAHSAGLCCLTIMANGGLTQRYLLPVEMLLFVALVALLNPRSVRPLATFAAVVVFIGAVNYRWHDTYRSHAPVWTEQVRRGVVECHVPGRREVQLRSGPSPWFSLVTVPCHYLNPNLWCQSPYCVQVGAPGRPPARTP